MLRYSRNTLISLRKDWINWRRSLSPSQASLHLSLSRQTWLKLTSLNLLARGRGQRGGNHLRISKRQRIPVRINNQQGNSTSTNSLNSSLNIQFDINHNLCSLNNFSKIKKRNVNNLIQVKISKPGPTPPKRVPSCMAVNARSLAKPDAASALSTEMRTNNIDLCFVSETWLNSKVPSTLICPEGYVLIRKDRSDLRVGGGVAILCRSDWKLRIFDSSNDLECLWCEITLLSSKFYIASIYHPPDSLYDETELLDYLSETCEQILLSDPNARIVIAGDINQLKIKDVTYQYNLKQLVNKPTRGEKILDVFLTNSPHLWKQPRVFKCLVRTDHKAIMITPNTPVKPERKYVFFRDVRDHRKLDMQQKLEACDWNRIFSCSDANEAAQLLNDTLIEFFNESFPLLKVKMSTRDPPYISPLVKYLCRKRNKNIQNSNNPILQERINELIRQNQVNAVQNENKKHITGSKGWWSTVNKITGRKQTSCDVSSIIDPDTINHYFQEINTDHSYINPKPLPLLEETHIPTLSVLDVQKSLLQQKRTAPGPDGLPYWIWRNFAHYLAPVVTTVFNLSLRQQIVPLIWKRANITPIPKELPLTTCDQLRPISLTNIIMRIFEKLVIRQEISQILKTVIKSDQFAYKEGSNTTMALVKCQHNWLKWLDRNSNFVRVLSFDFSKAFDSVPHDIVSNKLKTTGINPYIINWTINFLQNRKQRVAVEGRTTDYVDINKGVPQGTVLGPILFSLMVNDIKLVHPNTNLMVKFADDITISSPVKENSDLAHLEVTNIEHWAKANKMSLNLSKSWELLVRTKTTKPPPPPLPGIKRKAWLKLLGVTFQEDPCCWDMQFENLLSKACSRLYILRVCKYYGYSTDQLSKLFDSLIMSLFAYGVEVWGSALQGKYLQRIDNFCKRAYKYGYTEKTYKMAELIENKDMKLFKSITSNSSHSLSDMLPPVKTRKLRERGHQYILPKVRTERFKRCFLNRCLFNFV